MPIFWSAEVTTELQFDPARCRLTEVLGTEAARFNVFRVDPTGWGDDLCVGVHLNEAEAESLVTSLVAEEPRIAYRVRSA